jgi:hypothetical protein
LAKEEKIEVKNKSLTILVAAFSLFGISGVAHAVPVSWTDWTSGVVGTSGSGTGNILFGGSTISVGYTGEVRTIQTSGGTNWWTEGTPAPYTGNAVIDNAPPASDIITVQRAGITNTITFSTPLVDPVMAFVSIGQPGLPVDYAFDATFRLLSEGEGWWGDGSWTQVGNTLTGREAHGAIQFNGTFSSISWTNNPAENWHGFTIGATAIPIPAAAWLFATGLLSLLGFTKVNSGLFSRKTIASTRTA